MRQEQRQRIGPTPGSWMKWRSIPSIGRDELAEAVESCLVSAPVVLLAPVGDQRLHVGEVAAVLPAAAGFSSGQRTRSSRTADR